MKQISIRLRLTVWYTLVLAAGLGLFSLGFWLALRQALYSSAEITLRQHVEGLAGLLRTEAAESPTIGHLREESTEYANAVPEGMWLEARDTRGELILESRGKIGAARHRVYSGREVRAAGNVYRIEASASLDSADGILARMGWLMLLAIPLALALAGLGGYALARKALAPVDRITAAARSITIHNLEQRLDTPRTRDELQRLAEAWNDTLTRLDKAVKRLTQFTADASHELRTPIALIRTSAELALRRERSPEEYRETLRDIRDESERTSRLVEDLLTLARADAGGQPLPVRRLDLAELVREAGEHARHLAVGRTLRVSEDLPDGPVAMAGNEAGLRRLFAVLVDNAVKYTGDGGEIRLSLAKTPAGLAVQVRDTGIGMDAAAIPHVFERFYRADESRSRDVGGAGLGLSIAKWIADRHGACIQVESEAGRGSVFTVQFPG